MISPTKNVSNQPDHEPVARDGANGQIDVGQPFAAAAQRERDGDRSDEGDVGENREHGQGQQPCDLLLHHSDLLRKSGIIEAVQRARGYRSVESAGELAKFGFAQNCPVPALLFPIFDLNGEVAFHQARPDQPRIIGEKIAKHEVPKGKHYVVDVSPLARIRVLDRKTRLFIVIGVRKADALVSRGECAIAILGPTGWKNQESFWDQVPLENRPVVVVLDSDTMADNAAKSAARGLKCFLEGKKAKVRIIVLPTDIAGRKVGVDEYLAADKTVADLLALQQPDLTENDGGYRSMPDGLYRVISNEKGERLQRLTNFPAKIVSELIVTDGVDETREFEIEATVGGEIKQITVTATEFESMNWVAKSLGARAILNAGYGIRDHVRVAIQQLSSRIAKSIVYTHTGWVRHNGRSVFLHAGGAIGAEGEIGLAAGDHAGGAAAARLRAAGRVDAEDLADGDAPHPGNVAAAQDAGGKMVGASGVEGGHGADIQVARVEDAENRPTSGPLVDKDLRTGGTIGSIGKQNTYSVGIRVRLPSVLQGYRLPPPPTGDTLVKAVRVSLDFLKTAPDRLSIPLYAAIWRAVLGEVNFSLQLVGKKETGKTVLSALLQQHFGANMDAENLPAAWFSTGNAIVATTHLAKDVLLTVDDFVPTGSRGDVDQMHKKAELVLRSQGNRAGRARCRGDGTLVEGKAPRGLTLSTGEDTPDGPSLNSRGLILPVGPADVNWDWVTKCQGHAALGLFAEAMAGYVQWMAKDYDRIVRRTQEQIRELRGCFSRTRRPPAPLRSQQIFSPAWRTSWSSPWTAERLEKPISTTSGIEPMTPSGRLFSRTRTTRTAAIPSNDSATCWPPRSTAGGRT